MPPTFIKKCGFFVHELNHLFNIYVFAFIYLKIRLFCFINTYIIVQNKLEDYKLSFFHL